MRTRNSYFPNNSFVTIPRRRNKRRTPNVVEPELRTIVKVAPMADNCTMEELLQAPTEGYGEAIVIPKINVDHFEIKRICYNWFKRTHSLNATAGGNILSKTTREALQIIENKSKVRYSRNKPNVSRMNTNSWENASKTDNRIDKLADQISTLVDIFAKKVATSAPVKAVEESCGGAHAYYNYPNTDSNQLSVCTATGTYNQVAPQNRASNYMAPPGFAPVQNCQNRLNDQKLREKATNQMEKFFQIFQDFHFDISFADALLLMPKFASTIKSLLTNKDKLFELAKIPLNENCSVMLLKQLPEKLVDPGKFLIPCDFLGMDVCHALADLGASINLMSLSVWKKISLPELTPTRMTLELADQSITRPKGVAEDVFVKVGKFHFLADFVVVDFEADPRIPLILGRSFLRTDRALIDVYGEEITLRVNDKAVTFNLNQTTRYSSTYNDLSVNRIDIIDVAREEYTQEILEEIEAYLKDESISPEIDHVDCDLEGDICLIENLLNNDPFQLPPMDLKQDEVVKAKSLIKEPPKLELKDLPSHLEYAYLEGVDKLPVIIAKDLKVDEKEALLKVLKSHKRAIAWINDEAVTFNLPISKPRCVLSTD
nr:reverse transcriptase domain-containing protein [Tanacetum cinerariifolium]